MLPVRGGRYTRVDLDIGAELAGKRLSTSRNPHNGLRYVKMYRAKLHRFIVAAAPRQIVDHANGDQLDNRRENLRLASPGESNANRRGWASCGYKGVKPCFNRFIAYAKANGKQYHLGTHATAEAAARAYDAFARVTFGTFARLNFPEVAA